MAELTATQRIVDFLSDWKSRARIFAELEGVDYIDGTMSTMLRNGRLLRRGNPGAYEYKANSEWARTKRVTTPRASQSNTPDRLQRAPARALPAATFGVACLAPPAPAGCKALQPAESVHEAIADCLSVELCQSLVEIADLLDGEWSKSKVIAALGEMVADGRVLSAPSEHGGCFYALPASSAEAALEETRSPDEAAGAIDRAQHPGVRESGQPPRESRAASPVGDSLGFQARLEAIASDLDDALQDACDELLPHPLIKALGRAQSYAWRALRALEA